MATLDINNIFQTQLFEKNVLVPYFKEYINNTVFSRYMGGSEAVICKVPQSRGHGDVIVFPTRQTFMPNVKLGEDQLVGAESELTYAADEVRIGTLRFASRITNEQLLYIQSKLKFDSDLTNDLLIQGSFLNTKRIVATFGLSFAPSVTNRRDFVTDYRWLKPEDGKDTYVLVKEKIAACGIDLPNPEGDAVSSNRVMFGLDAKADKTIDATIKNANFTIANGHGMSLRHIRRLVSLAGTGGRTDNMYKESPVRPYAMRSPHHAGYIEPRYILFMAPEAHDYMAENDPDWKAQLSRGTIESSYQPSIMYSGGFRGSVVGADVVVVNELSNFIQNYTAYSILCGASAMGYGLGSPPRFEYEKRDLGMHKIIAHEEISGMKVLKYPSKSDPKKRGNNNLLVENGIVHSFTKIA